MSNSEYSEKTTVQYIVYCEDFKDAATYAAERSWHLSWWSHHVDNYAPVVPIVYTRDFSVEWLDG